MNKLTKLSNSIPAFFSALFNKNTPISAKIAVLAAILYALAPADLVADVVPVLGWLDDALVMTVLFAIANRMIPDVVKEADKANQAKNSGGDYIDELDYEVIED